MTTTTTTMASVAMRASIWFFLREIARPDLRDEDIDRMTGEAVRAVYAVAERERVEEGRVRA